MITADTNLFIHAADPDSQHHAKAREFFAELASQEDEFVVCELVLVELYMQVAERGCLCEALHGEGGGRILSGDESESFVAMR